MTKRLLLLFVAGFCISHGTGCSGPAEGAPALKEGDPTIERIEGTGDVTIPAHILVCGYNKVLNDEFTVLTYNDESPGAMSLYDFWHSDAQLQTWMAMHPGGRAYDFRKKDAEAKESAAIGRRIGEPCFGNGDDATAVIRQVVVLRAAGADANEALHNLLREDRTAHFVIDREGVVFQTLDPVHAAWAPDETNGALFVALVTPRRLHEWLPGVVSTGGSRGMAGALKGSAPGIGEGQKLAMATPPDAFSERRQCEVRGKTVESEVYAPKQLTVLRQLVVALGEEYPEITLEYPLSKDGTPLRSKLDSAEFHRGVLADYNMPNGSMEPACLDLGSVFAE